MKTKETGSMNDHELLQQALNALKHLCLHSAAIKGYDGEQVQTAIDALKARLAQPEPEPVGYIDKEQLRRWNVLKGTEYEDAERCYIPFSRKPFKSEMTDCSLAVYAAPPKKEWVGLTDAEVEKVFFDMGQFAKIDLKTFARAIEAKLKEKNT